MSNDIRLADVLAFGPDVLNATKSHRIRASWLISVAIRDALYANAQA